ncbi:DUF6265 family protein [Poritiphilus flavus]|uniref:DUF6265 domain-containing protein n=1 Tax=Poritiphilus flavus TaxID=2697053 RepID=A0A6L9E7U3_9FLAO|nr:DUF6265 family protein [Poritiphilus flavus]NAS10714.1 hypothetical protein [Poritiphilus flavus]
MRFLIYCCLLTTFTGMGQNTMEFKEGMEMPPASLKEVTWIAGHWQGEAFGGLAEEIWSPPLGDSMMFVFKHVADGKVTFYEVGHIQQKEASLILQLKHFHGSLKGWEEKDETVDFKLVKLDGNRAYFDGFTIEYIDENHMNMYVLIDDGSGSKEVAFNYTRQ